MAALKKQPPPLQSHRSVRKLEDGSRVYVRVLVPGSGAPGAFVAQVRPALRLHVGASTRWWPVCVSLFVRLFVLLLHNTR